MTQGPGGKKKLRCTLVRAWRKVVLRKPASTVTSCP